MELYKRELAEAEKRIDAAGKDKDDYAFKMTYLPPDPDGGGMFTERYEIEITNTKNGKSITAVGGIGLDWVGYFEEALSAKYFD